MSIQNLRRLSKGTINGLISSPLITWLSIVAIMFIIGTNIFNDNALEHYALLARSFLQGRLDIPNGGALWDITIANGLAYFPLGPFPALLLIPFVGLTDSFGFIFKQGYLQWIITIVIFYSCYYLARRQDFSHTNALWLALAFCWATPYHIISLLTLYGFFSHAVAVGLLFLALLEWYKKRRWWIIGLLLAATFATRTTAGLGVVFFIVDIVSTSTIGYKKQCKQLMQLLLPVVITGLLLLAYNQARFGNFFDNGYQETNGHIRDAGDRFERSTYGLFQLRNIPTEIYYYFIKMPDPVLVTCPSSQFCYTLKPPYITVNRQTGVSFFVAAPIFLLLFGKTFRERLKRRERLAILSLLPVIVIMPFLLAYYWPGWLQTGPRYTLDFLPFTYISLLLAFPNQTISNWIKALILGSITFNFFLLFSVLGPH